MIKVEKAKQEMGKGKRQSVRLLVTVLKMMPVQLHIVSFHSIHLLFFARFFFVFSSIPFHVAHTLQSAIAILIETLRMHVQALKVLTNGYLIHCHHIMCPLISHTRSFIHINIELFLKRSHHSAHMGI